MYLSRIDLRPEAATLPAFVSRLADGHGIHAIVWSLFGDSPDRRRDFLYRTEERAGPGLSASLLRVYTLSERPPVDPLGIFEVATQRFEPQLSPGERLAFMARVNPVVRVKTSPGVKNAPKHDVVMDAKRRLKADGQPIPSESELVQTCCENWLRRRAEAHGFEIESLRADGYRQHRLRRRRGEQELRFSTVELEGVLRVTDPTRLVETLRTGLGAAKGFGCGLLLVRRA